MISTRVSYLFYSSTHAIYNGTGSFPDPHHRQIPYAIGQFTVNELCHEIALRSMSEETKKNLSSTSQFGISLGSGIIAGFAAAILSQVCSGASCLFSSPLTVFSGQPADTLLSQINKGHGPEGSMMYRLGTLAKQAGVKGLFAGLGPRMVMTAGLVSGQFLIYGAVKQGGSMSHRYRFTYSRLRFQRWVHHQVWRSTRRTSRGRICI